MKFTRNTVNGINDTILASNDYTAIPFTVTETAAVKAGYPMTLAGKKAVAVVKLVLRPSTLTASCCMTLTRQRTPTLPC